MSLDDKSKRRLLTFSVILIFLAIPFFTEDIIYRVIAAVILVIYVGFIIFLRDSSKQEELPQIVDNRLEEPTIYRTNTYETDSGEDFKIVSKNKTIEIITSDNFHTNIPKSERGDVFKPADFKKNFESIVLEELPKDINQDEQFGFVLEKILSVIKDAYTAHTAAFFWYNSKRKRLTLERYVSVSTQITKQKFELENDILGKIVQTEEPEILTDITSNAEVDNLRYYNQPQGIKSFVGIPLFYGKALTGILVLDSKMNDAFGIEQVYSLGKIVRVISVIINLFEEKFAESQAEQRLKTLVEIFSYERKYESESELFQAIETAVHGLLDWDVFTIVTYEPVEHKFKTAKIVNKTSLKYIGHGLVIDLTGTLVGRAILSSTPVKIDDTSSADIPPRFAKNEGFNFDGSFLAVPLVYDEQNYGVLCFESLKKNVYSNSEVAFIKSATKIFAFVLHSYSSLTILRSFVSHDIETKALNYDSFLERFTVDLVKSRDLTLQGAVALIKVDELLEQQSLFEGDPFPKVFRAVAQMIREEMTPFNLFGRINEKVFAVYFFNTTPKDVFLWAEKLRIKIARKPIAVVSKQSTFTVSIGVASTIGKIDAREIIDNAQLALKKAIEKGGNSVKSTN
ncbi:MAG: diguanylate cyclase [Ignavibacteria bacterium]|nr:MAG: diguanylate cyclase [Ignavibacteria bacterium]KAF0157266.1 MAG: diguanylate cyclase [Ignavibacteria bacterium]